MEDYSQTINAAKQLFSKRLVICGLAVVISVGLVDRTNAVYLYSDCSPTSIYAKCNYYSLTTDWSIIKLHPSGVLYDKMYTWRHIPISEYYILLYCHFNTGDYIDRGQYYHLDVVRYYYLDRWQYNLLGRSGCSFIYPYYHERYYSSGCQFGKVDVYVIPEPTTIVFLGLGALGVLGYRNIRWRMRGSVCDYLLICD